MTLIEYRRIYYQNHRPAILARCKQNYQDKRAARIAYQRAYRAKKKGKTDAN